MPSPTSTTVPTLRDSAPSSKCSIVFLMMLTISSERMAMPSPFGPKARRACRRPRLASSLDQLRAEPLEAAAYAGIDLEISDSDAQPAKERRVRRGRKLYVPSGKLLDPLLHGCELLPGERCGRGDGCRHDATGLPNQGIVLGNRH